MSYWLSYRQQELELREGHFLIGRSDGCQLVLSDPLVSRVHARIVVDGRGLTVEDLGSRNGVTVNSEPIKAATRIRNGDRIQVGEQQMIVVQRSDARLPTMSQKPLRTEESVAVLSSVAEKALALGHGDQAERLLENYLSDLLAAAEAGRAPDSESVGRATDFAVGLANLTGKARWVHFIFRLHSAVGKPCSAGTVDRLYEMVRRIDVGPESLRDYLQVLDKGQAQMTKAERFVYKRLQGLESLASLR